MKLGADVNRRNDANATALMWAAADLEKTRLLVAQGADVNARSSQVPTPLMIAARRPGNSAAVQFLLDHGANPNPNPHPVGESSPLIEAANAGDAASMELLLAHGAEVKDAEPALEVAYAVRCSKCAGLGSPKVWSKQDYTTALPNIAFLGDVNAVRQALDHGASPNAVDPLGRTPLMYAVASDLLNLDVVRLLVERGAGINARDSHQSSGDAGLSVLDIARGHGETPVVAWLVKAGAKGTTPSQPVLKSRRQNNIRSAIQSSLPLIQRADANFIPKAACISCHNDSFAAMAVGAARKSGFQVGRSHFRPAGQSQHRGPGKTPRLLASGLLHSGGRLLRAIRGELHPNGAGCRALPAGSQHRRRSHVPQIASDSRRRVALRDRRPTPAHLLGLYRRSSPSPSAHSSFMPPSWIRPPTTRPSSSARRGSPKPKPPTTTIESFGCCPGQQGKTSHRKRCASRFLESSAPMAAWSDLDTTESTALATGKSLYALQVAGLAASDTAYQRAVQYLLNTQQEDGSWFVRTRAMALQPYFDSGFPHGYNQFISAAGTSWATVALSRAAQAPR